MRVFRDQDHNTKEEKSKGGEVSRHTAHGGGRQSQADIDKRRRYISRRGLIDKERQEERSGLQAIHHAARRADSTQEQRQEEMYSRKRIILIGGKRSRCTSRREETTEEGGHTLPAQQR